MANAAAEQFARLLTEAVYRIRHLESKNIGLVQDELGYALGKKGGASIEYWRKGNLPTKAADIENLARELRRRTDFRAAWMRDFLDAAGYSRPEMLQAELFPTESQPTAVTPTAVPNNLPVQPTPFLGRESELEAIGEKIRDTAVRLITLVGPGGIGKTRLAIRAARHHPHLFPDGVFFVGLASLNSPEFLVSTIATSIQFPFYNDETLKPQLLHYLQDKKMLIIMDNFEHLMSEVGLVVEILQNAPSVQMIFTSRERLNLRGEWVFAIKGMDFPARVTQFLQQPARRLAFDQYSAVQLFVASARRVQADFVLTDADKRAVAHICQLVEGIPLGIELAASWVRVLSCAEIASEIERSYEFLASSWRDLPERHRSLQAVFDYSWDLLEEPEKEAVQNLSVFQGGFAREAATVVAGASLLTLTALVDKSLLYRTLLPVGGSSRRNGRYEMHELLRLYAAEKLALGNGSGDLARDRHCAFYADNLAALTAQLEGGRQREALEAIGVDIENIRNAWQWAVRRGKLTQMGQMLDALFYFYDIRSWLHEGQVVFARAVDELENHEQTRETAVLLGKALARQGRFYHRLGQYHKGRQVLEKSLAILEPLHLPQETAFVGTHLGKIAYRLGEHAIAQTLCQESLAMCRRIDYAWGIVSTLETLGNLSAELGDYAEAERLHQEGLAICREVGDKRGVAIFMNGLATTRWRVGDYEQARELSQESLRLYQQVGDQRGIAMAYKNLGNVAADTNDYPQADVLYQQSLEICQEIGYQWGVAALLNNQGSIAWELGAYAKARSLCHQSVSIWRKIGFQWGIAGTLETLGNVATELGEFDEAKAAFREAIVISREIHALPLLLDVLIGISKLLAALGEEDLAFATLAMVRAHPAIDQEGRKKAEQVLGKISASFTAVMKANLAGDGQTRQLDDIIPDMLDILSR